MAEKLIYRNLIRRDQLVEKMIYGNEIRNLLVDVKDPRMRIMW